jgi:hypothetical protein
MLNIWLLLAVRAAVTIPLREVVAVAVAQVDY